MSKLDIMFRLDNSLLLNAGAITHSWFIKYLATVSRIALKKLKNHLERDGFSLCSELLID
jgi:hypothetical protein